ncbi:MAG: xylulokinase [Lactobacillales bacterium]|jgi:xylulokinase|nr:xylulokinase [Lactobacillales bacterium]
MSYVLGIDLGTSSLKGLLMDKNGEVIFTYAAEYGLDTPKPGYSEQRPEFWITAAEIVLTEMSLKVPDFGSRLEGISFSGQMHSLVILGEDKKPLYPAILWNDVRTTEECKTIMAEAGDLVKDLTKNIALEGFTLPKMLWLQKNEPAVWANVKHFMLPKDYLGFWMTGELWSDYSDAAGTLLLDLEKSDWAWPIADKFNIPREIFPQLTSGSGKVGELKAELRERFGITNTVPVFAGGADNACAALGAGIVKDGIGWASIGTSGVFGAFEPSAEKSYGGLPHLFNHVVDNSYYSMGVTLAAGNSLDWFLNTFAPGESYKALDEIYTVAPGSDGLIFTPYIVGERTPHPDAQIRGSFLGIDTHHERKHFARAVLEGITFSLKDSQALMERIAGKKFTKIISVGGGAKNPDWLQMQADIFNASIVTLTVEQGPGQGAAMLAAMGAGWFATAEDCAATFVKYKDYEYTPKAANVATYEKMYSIYAKAYDATKEISHELQGEF